MPRRLARDAKAAQVRQLEPLADPLERDAAQRFEAHEKRRVGFDRGFVEPIFLEEIRVQHRVEHERQEGRGNRRSVWACPRAADQPNRRHKHERDVRELADQPLLGTDRDRDRV